MRICVDYMNGVSSEVRLLNSIQFESYDWIV